LLFPEEGWEQALCCKKENMLLSYATFNSINNLDADNEGVAIIYDFVWGSGDVMAHLVFAKQKASLKKTKKTSKIQPDVMSEANTTLQNALKTLESQYE
jgi:hypothetical protein